MSHVLLMYPGSYDGFEMQSVDGRTLFEALDPCEKWIERYFLLT